MPGFAHDDRDAALAVARHLLERREQLRELRVAPDERRHRAQRRAVEARLAGGARPISATSTGRSKPFTLTGPIVRASMWPSASRTVSAVASTDPGFAICSMRAAMCTGLADRRVAHVQAVAADVERDLARIEADANLDRHAVRALHVVAVMADEIEHRQRGMAGAHRMVLPGDRRAEQRHDAVAHDLAHGAAEFLDGVAHVLQRRIEQLARFLGVAIGDELQSSP